MVFFNKNRRERSGNNRVNFLIAIVFLFGLAIIFKLYDLQVVKHSYYSARASGQHNVYNRLEPERGEIFIIDKKEGSEEVIYPLAINKDYALIYAVPVEMEDAESRAEKLFIVFDKEKAVEEIEKYFIEKDKEELAFELGLVAGLGEEERIKKEGEIKYRFNLLRNDKTWLEVRESQKEAEVEKRKKEASEAYVKILTKKNDPYEPLKNKVNEEKLKEFYALLLSDKDKEIAPEKLIMKNGEIFQKISDEETGGDEKLKKVQFKGISHIMKRYRYYPENNIGAHILGFVNEIENELRGNYGLEGFFDRELFGQYGSVKSERGANKNIIILNDREYVKPENGGNLVLTINRSIQFFACQKLAEAVEKYDADSGSVAVVDPKTGAMIAMCSWPDFDPNNYGQVVDMNIYNNPIVFEQYEPGSVFKVITMAAALDKEKISPSTVFEDKGSIMIEGWPKPIRNSDFETKGGHGLVDMNYVLANSLNLGVIFVANKLGADVFADYIKKFGFGEKTGIELQAEASGNINNLISAKIRPINAATASFGQGLTATPLQMLMSYAAIANGGVLMKPFIVKEIIHGDGSKDIIRPVQVRRVVSERAANLTIGMMANVVETGHAKKAGVEGYYVAGKTGTAQVASTEKVGYKVGETIHNFVGLAPVEDPKFVMIVKFNNPKNVKFSSDSATPVFGEIAEFILKYYQVPKK